MSFAGKCPHCDLPYERDVMICGGCGAAVNPGARIDATPDYVAPAINTPSRFSLASIEGHVVAALSEEIWRQRREEGVSAALDLDLRKLAASSIAAVKQAQVSAALDDVRKEVNALRETRSTPASPDLSNAEGER